MCSTSEHISISGVLNLHHRQDRPLTSPAVSPRGGLKEGQKSSLYAMFKSRKVVF